MAATQPTKKTEKKEEEKGKVEKAKGVVEEKEEVKEETKTEDNKNDKEVPKVNEFLDKKKDSGKDKKAGAVELEREYVIPLKRGVLNVPQYRRAKKAVRLIKEFLARHMRVEDRDLRKVKVDIYLNNEVWFRGIKKPANKIKVKAVKRDGIVYAELAEIPDAVKFARMKNEKRLITAKLGKIKKKDKEKAPNGVPQGGGGKEKVDGKEDDKDGDGVKDEKEEKEDRKAGAEKKEKEAKVESKVEKHTAKAKTGKQDKGMIQRKALKR